MKHMGKVRVGIRARIISLMIVVNVMICLVMGVLLLKRVKINYIKQGTREAITTSRLISQMIDVEDIKEIITSKEMNDAYQNVKKVMQKATDNSKAEYIYLVGKVENELVYIVDTSVEDDRYAPVEKEYYEEINQVLSGKTYQSDAMRA